MVTGWIVPVAGNPLKAECRYCKVLLNTSLADMKRHAKTSKHARFAGLPPSAVEKRRSTSNMSPAKRLKPMSEGLHFSFSNTVIRWLRGSAVERQSVAGELSLSCARPVAEG